MTADINQHLCRNALGVDFAEEPGSPSYTCSKEGFQATRVLTMPWSEAQGFVSLLFDKKITDPNRALYYSDRWLVAVKADIKPKWDGRQAGITSTQGPNLGETIATYDRAIVTITYETPRISDIELDMGTQLVGSKGEQYKFNGTDRSPDGNVQKTEPVIDFRFRFDADNFGDQGVGALGKLIDNINANIGKINSDDVALSRSTQGGVAGIAGYDPYFSYGAFPAGTCLFTGADVQNSNKYGALNPIYDLRFKYKKTGWNNHWDPKDKQYKELLPKPFGDPVPFNGTVLPAYTDVSYR